VETISITKEFSFEMAHALKGHDVPAAYSRTTPTT